MDKDTDTDTDMNMDTGFGNTFVRYQYCSLVPLAPYRLPDTSPCKFQRRYKIVAPLPNENYDMSILTISYRHWN
jgi:hypothetical protein